MFQRRTGERSPLPALEGLEPGSVVPPERVRGALPLGPELTLVLHGHEDVEVATLVAPDGTALHHAAAAGDRALASLGDAAFTFRRTDDGAHLIRWEVVQAANGPGLGQRRWALPWDAFSEELIDVAMAGREVVLLVAFDAEHGRAHLLRTLAYDSTWTLLDDGAPAPNVETRDHLVPPAVREVLRLFVGPRGQGLGIGLLDAEHMLHGFDVAATGSGGLVSRGAIDAAGLADDPADISGGGSVEGGLLLSGPHSNRSFGWGPDGQVVASPRGPPLGPVVSVNDATAGQHQRLYTARLGQLDLQQRAELDTRLQYAAGAIVRIQRSGRDQQVVHGPDGLPVALVDEGGWHHLHYGLAGRVVAATDADGALEEAYTWSAYGEPVIVAPDGSRRSASAIDNHLLSVGQPWLPHLGLHAYGARMYRPRWGRFLTPDPLGFVDGLNRFAFVGGHPLEYIDPLGTKGYSLTGVMAGVIQAHPGVSRALDTAYGIFDGLSPVSFIDRAPFGNETAFREASLKTSVLAAAFAAKGALTALATVKLGPTLSLAGPGGALAGTAVSVGGMGVAGVLGTYAAGMGRRLSGERGALYDLNSYASDVAGGGGGASTRRVDVSSTGVHEGTGAAKGVPSVARITPGLLPAAEETAVLNTLRHIDAGTKPTGAPAKKWGTQFKNWAGNLPGAKGAASPFREYRVAPPAGTTGPGTRRIVVNQQTGEMFYTWTHYGDTAAPAFVKIR